MGRWAGGVHNCTIFVDIPNIGIGVKLFGEPGPFSRTSGITGEASGFRTSGTRGVGCENRGGNRINTNYTGAGRLPSMRF
jgi:hypothetical protein